MPANEPSVYVESCPDCAADMDTVPYSHGSLEHYWHCDGCGRDFDEEDLGVSGEGHLSARPPP